MRKTTFEKFRRQTLRNSIQIRVRKKPERLSIPELRALLRKGEETVDKIMKKTDAFIAKRWK